MPACALPPELTDAELLRAASGDPGDQTAEHLDRCPYCTDRLKHLEASLTLVTGRVYRAKCPPTMTLSAYHTGDLTEAEADSIRDHLELCAECRREVIVFRQFIDAIERDEQIDAGQIERPGIFAFSFLDASAAVPAEAGIRGGFEDAPRIVTVESFQITLTVEQDPSRPEQHSLYGLVTGERTAGWAVYLWQGDSLIAQFDLQEDGSFDFEDLPPGDYTLIVDGSEGEVHIRDVHF